MLSYPVDVTFEIPLVPKGKQAPRFNHSTGHVHKEPETRRWEALLASYVSTKMPKEVIDHPVEVYVLAVFPRPAKMNERHSRGTEKGRLKLSPYQVHYGKKPDIDNIQKSVFDSLRASWRDDALISGVKVFKRFADYDGKARIVVRIRSARKEWSQDKELVALGLLKAEDVAVRCSKCGTVISTTEKGVCYPGKCLPAVRSE